MITTKPGQRRQRCRRRFAPMSGGSRRGWLHRIWRGRRCRKLWRHADDVGADTSSNREMGEPRSVEGPRGDAAHGRLCRQNEGAAGKPSHPHFVPRLTSRPRGTGSDDLCGERNWGSHLSKIVAIDVHTHADGPRGHPSHYEDGAETRAYMARYFKTEYEPKPIGEIPNITATARSRQ